MKPTRWPDMVSAARRSRGRQLLLVSGAVVLFAAVGASGIVVAHPPVLMLLLLGLPVGVVAVTFGRWAGLVAAGTAGASAGAWDTGGGSVGGLTGFAIL